MFPYNLGPWRNIRQVVNLTCEPQEDGIDWPVGEDCDQFDLTVSVVHQGRREGLRVLCPTKGALYPPDIRLAADIETLDIGHKPPPLTPSFHCTVFLFCLPLRLVPMICYVCGCDAA